MNKILLGTSNKGKVNELKRILKDGFEKNGLDIEILSLNDFESVESPVEDGKTFMDNALIKANYYYNHFNIPVITDDSGLIVDALNGAPGVYSARYSSNPEKIDQDKANRDKLLSDLKNIENREGRYYCAIVFYDGNTYIKTTGTTEGYILKEEIGNNGFGYDCIFYANEYNDSIASLSDEKKDEISHRGKALRELQEQLIVFCQK